MRPGATGRTGKTLAAAPPPPGGRAAALLRLGPAAWEARGPGGGGRRPACQRERRGLVCQRLPPPPPARPASRRRPPPRGLAGCRLHRRGFAPFSRPLRLPELIWELFISCQKAAGPAKQTTLAAGPPGWPGWPPWPAPARPRAPPLPGTPGAPAGGRAGARRGQRGPHLVALRSRGGSSQRVVTGQGVWEKLIDFNDRFPGTVVTQRGSS